MNLRAVDRGGLEGFISIKAQVTIRQLGHNQATCSFSLDFFFLINSPLLTEQVMVFVTCGAHYLIDL